MVNRAATKKSAQRSKERSQKRRDMLWKPVSFWEEDKDAKERNKSLKKGAKKEPEFITVPRHVTILTKLSDAIENINEHDWQGQKRLKPSHVCPRLEYDDDYCEICSTEAKYPCTPTPYGKVLCYLHDYVGQVFRKTDSKGNKVRMPYETKRVLRIPRDAEGVWELLEELEAEGKLKSAVLQVKHPKGPNTFTLVEATDRVVRKLPNEGKIPREVRLEVKEYETDFIWQHLLNTADGVRFDHWGVDEPVIERDKIKDEESSDESYPDDEDEDEDYTAGDDEDEDDDDRGARRSKKKSAASKKPSSKSSKPKPSTKSKRKVDDDDDDDDEYDDEDEDEDDEDERPRGKKKKPPAKPAAKSKPKPKRKVDEDDDEDAHWSDEDDEDDDEEEEERPRSKAKSKPKAPPKSKSKPPAPKSKKKPADDDEFEDDEELEDDFDDEFEEDEDEDDED